MDNINIKKIWSDNELNSEIIIIAKSEYVNIMQQSYISQSESIDIGKQIILYSQSNGKEDLYVEFGIKSGNYTPAFSMKFLKLDNLGHINIEIDMEIDDNEERLHRCIFYVKSDLGSIEKMGNFILNISKSKIGTDFYIHDL